MKKQLFALLFSLLALTGIARTVTGTVIQVSDGEPITGASVTVKGVKGGAVTDIDGKYSINVADDNAVLQVAFVGMKPMEKKVGSSSVVDFAMSENAEMLSEVVVTAMGQSQEKSKLNFSVQELKSDDVTAGQSANFVSSLQGKVSGLQVSNAGGSANSDTQIIIRGVSSVNPSQSNEPLFVIDGMPIRGGGSSMADLNPADIESMSVLKGAAASALYGQEGANGVILITTKSGKDGRVTVTLNGGWEISRVMDTPKLQDTFIGGASGFTNVNSSGGWGPRRQPGDPVYDNVGKFLGTGFMQKYDLTISGGNELFSTYASVGYMGDDGVVPEDYKKKINVFVKGEYNPSKQVKIMLSTNFVDTKGRAFGNSMSSVYGWAINRDMSDYVLPNGLPNWACRYDDWEILTNQQRLDAGLSPYYSRYMDDSKTRSNRIIVNGSIQYEPIKNLTFTGKVNYDLSNSIYESWSRPRYTSTMDEFDMTKWESALNEAYHGRMGTYTYQPSRGDRFTAQALGNYYWEINDNFNLNFFVGAEYTESTGTSGSFGGKHFLLDGDYYSFNNLDFDYFKGNLSLSHTSWNKYGYFGEIRFDYNKVIQVSATGRMDGSSRFKQAKDTNYFYPSFTGGVIFTELFKIQSPVFNYGKIRGNWAKVGKDGPPNLFSDNYKQWINFPDGGYGVDPTVSRAIILEPEMTSTWEIGADLRFFQNRTRLDVGYYSTTVDNQIVTVRVSPAAGTILQTRNEGTVENHGVEATLTQEIIRGKDFNWTATLNFTMNRGKLKKLPEDVSEVTVSQYGDIFNTAYVGQSTTSISGIDYSRAPDGQVLIDASGLPIVSPKKDTYIGNREPDCLLGLTSTFSWKDLSLSFLLDGRIGGDVANITGRSLFSNGMDWRSARYRNHKVIFKGVVEQEDGTYVPNTTPVILDSSTMNNYIYNVSSNFIEDGSYLRLSYVSLAYDFATMMRKLGSRNPIKGLKLSFTARNLFLLTKYSGVDPQVMAAASGGAGAMGIDNYSVPTCRSYNFNLNVTF
ncbi:MAG: SusC/RagA family TonB-linked outer membrane protein [Muribaculaceae bacterium]|nr:SusC/RagA family TonB-linked outer membrane protein [Muribaculaceae bacterium]